MSRCRTLTIVLTLSTLWVTTLRAGQSDGDAAGATISLIEKKLTDTSLQLQYEIRNGSNRDIWICESMDVRRRWDVEVYVGQDNETLFVQRRLDVPMTGYRDQPIGCYARLAAGQTRVETLSLRLPVRHQGVLFGTRGTQPRESAKRLVAAIGYCDERLPSRVSGGFVTGDHIWNERIEVPWDSTRSMQEKYLLVTAEDLTIPYQSEYAEVRPIHLSPCKRMEVHFARLPLEFLFPYASQHSLLSSEETGYLQSLRDFVVEDSWDMMGIAYDASEALPGTYFTSRSRVDLVCHRKDGSTVPLTVYDDSYIVTQDGQVFRCLNGLSRLRALTPEMRSFDLRVQCAANLRGLWHGCRRYGINRLPPAETWCDAVRWGGRVCPSAGQGKCHYAMNPACRHDSAGDVVLLFETKAGWNQHDGPELFTFENHQPRGGCILRNDGTVQFVRTPEELGRLRWK